MLQILGETGKNIIATKAAEKLTKVDYRKLLPLFKNALSQYGKIRWYFEMEDFKGWNLRAFWEEIKFEAQHAHDFEKIAMISEKKWREWIMEIMKPFNNAEIRFFDLNEKDMALSWIKSQ